MPIARRLAVLLTLALSLMLPAAASAKEPLRPYLALGDSLSVGEQPLATGESVNTSQGYAAQLGRRVGDVKVVNLGCGNATTESFIKGNRPCLPARDPGYANTSPQTSQLATAERFLRRNRRGVKFVTIDIGANDLLSCAPGGNIDFGCVNKSIEQIRKNSPIIARRLRRAAGPNVAMAVMTIYDPFLAQWFKGDSGKDIAKASADIAKNQVNAVIAKAFKRYGFRVARVAEAFNTYKPFEVTTNYRGQRVPLSVATVCRLSWICAAAPRGPNVHANRAGYGVMAGAFRKALGRAAG